MGKNKFQTRHVTVLGVLVLGLALSVGYLNYASALEIPPATGPNDVPRVATEDAFTGGVDLGTKSATNGEPVPLVQKPKYEGINAQWWANSNGSAQIPDDAIVHGIADSRNGFINTAYAQASGPAQTPQPVYIYDNLYIKGNTDTAEPGNLLVKGQISNTDSAYPVVVNGDLNVTGKTQIMGNTNVLGTVNAEKITGLSVGRFYLVPNTGYNNSGGTTNNTALSLSACSAGDIAISCSGWVSIFSARLTSAEVNNDMTGCEAQAIFADGDIRQYVHSTATCFSPNGD